jgi:hypothetical protein
MRVVKSVLGAFILVVTQNPIIGRSKQSMGSNTFTTYKGLNVLKTKPFSVANPKTAGQRAQRNSLALLVELYRMFKVLFNIGFKQAANPLSPYNWFVKTNLPNAVDSADPDAPKLDFQNLMIAKGSLPSTDIDTITADESLGTVVITWDSTLSSPDFSNTDKAYALIFNEATQAPLGVSIGVVPRSAGTLSITSTTPMTAGDIVHVYLFFVAADGSQVSDSETDSETVVA